MIDLQPINITKSKILIFEDQVYQQIALEDILFNELKLKKRISFHNGGKSIQKTIRNLYKEVG